MPNSGILEKIFLIIGVRFSLFLKIKKNFFLVKDHKIIITDHKSAKDSSAIAITSP